jgi:hypothetical protein
MSERRGSRRQKSFLRGVVYFDNGRSSMDCLVRDISEEGARIMLSESVIVPDAVKLHIPQRAQTRDARIQWRRGDEIGIAFADAKPAGAEGELAKRIVELEAEIATLRATIKRLRREKAGDDGIEAA